MKIILDTDIDTDCDDAGALAVLHGLARQGVVEILGIVCSIPIKWCPLFVLATNRWYGRDDIPVGMVHVPDWETNPCHSAYILHRNGMAAATPSRLYNEAVASRLPAPDGRIEDAVALYRRLLASQPDKSVTICAIGTLSALSRLLQSPPDEIAGADGVELVRSKVRKLVTMAVAPPPNGYEAFNWRMDLPAAAAVMSRWPSPIAVSSHGDSVLTGSRFMAAAPEDNPVSAAFRIWLGDRNGNRSSWDQLALLCAADQTGGAFAEDGGYAINLADEGARYEWVSSANGATRSFLRPLAPDTDLASLVEAWMVSSLPSRPA